MCWCMGSYINIFYLLSSIFYLLTFSKTFSLAPLPKRYFTVVSMAEKRMCKRGIRAIFFGTRTIFIRVVPNIFCSVNGP